MDLELLLAEYFGRDGDAGRFKALEDAVREHSVAIDSLKTFRTKTLVWGSVAIGIGGVVAGILAHLITRWL